MTKTKEQLLNIWFNVWYIGGWLRILGMTKEYDQEDLAEFEQIDENAIASSKEAKRYHWENIVPKIRSEINAFKKEFSQDFKKEKRLEYLNSCILSLEDQIAKIWKNYQEATERDVPYWLRSAIREIQNSKRLEKKVRSFTIEKYILENPEASKKFDRVSPEEIAHALAFPFDQLIEFNQAGFAVCPFHSEQRGSLHWIKESNRGYCFGCQWKGDVIQFVKDRNGLNFKEAVRSLCK